MAMLAAVVAVGCSAEAPAEPSPKGEWEVPCQEPSPDRGYDGDCVDPFLPDFDPDEQYRDPSYDDRTNPYGDDPYPHGDRYSEEIPHGEDDGGY